MPDYIHWTTKDAGATYTIKPVDTNPDNWPFKDQSYEIKAGQSADGEIRDEVRDGCKDPRRVCRKYDYNITGDGCKENVRPDAVGGIMHVKG
jgi:hypothetical protein